MTYIISSTYNKNFSFNFCIKKSNKLVKTPADRNNQDSR